VSSSGHRFDLPGGLSPSEEAAVIAALERYFAEDEETPSSNPWAMAGRLDATGMGALQTRRVSGWRAATRMPFARRGVPTFHGRGDAQ
jgi:hypothetical protein